MTELDQEMDEVVEAWYAQVEVLCILLESS